MSELETILSLRARLAVAEEEIVRLKQEVAVRNSGAARTAEAGFPGMYGTLETKGYSFG